MKIHIPWTNLSINIPVPPIDRINEAKRISEKAQNDVNEARKEVEKSRACTESMMEDYGKTKLNIYDTSLRKFTSLFGQIKNAELTSIKASDNLIYETLSVIKMKTEFFRTVDGVKALIAGGGSGATAGALVYGAVGYFATASTGSAIAGLSGVAATNATLAWLGGGSLAAGGLGVAGGTLILGGLIAIPALVVGGFILNSKSKEALNIAHENKALAKKFCAEADTAVAAMHLIKTRCKQMKEIANRIDHLFQNELAELQSIIIRNLKRNLWSQFMVQFKQVLAWIFDLINIEKPTWTTSEQKVDYAKFNQIDKERLMVIVCFAQTLKNILDTELLTKTGVVSGVSERVLKDSRRFLESRDISVH